MPLSPAEFVARWLAASQKESAAAKPHFIDLCNLLNQPTPVEADPDGTWYAFEKGASKMGGGDGFADVWMDGHFAWEYKSKGKSLANALVQLQQYRDALKNPPLLVVCDLDRFEVHTNFTGTVKQVYAFNHQDLLSPTPTPTCPLPPLEVLDALFTNPERLRPLHTTNEVTERAAAEFAHLAESLRKRGADPEAAARFLMRILFCLFAEDVKLLPQGLFTQLVERTRQAPDEFNHLVRQLFGVMSAGGWFGVERIRRFNGGLFTDSDALDLTTADLGVLARASKLDWASIEPAIFGALFERSLDPSKRSQLGAHYTGRDDILLIVEPVLMEPLRRRWEEVRGEALALVAKREEEQADIARRHAAVGGRLARSTHQDALETLLRGFVDHIASVRVLDPACGSGNFLYVALKRLLDIEKEVRVFAFTHNVSIPFLKVDPSQLYGIEVNPYAYELASVVVWIGYIQWLRENGDGIPSDPILKPLSNIRHMDAILAYDPEGRPVEPEWPQADVIIGNPPFLGGKRMRTELGDAYVDRLFTLYNGRVPHEADLVCYWFERARAQIAKHVSKRAGLLATNSIRQGSNRPILDKIKQTGDIFMAWADRPWILDGAAVRISMVGFDNGSEQIRSLDGALATEINSDLTQHLNLTQIQRLIENDGICLRADEKGGAFDIDQALAERMLKAYHNVNGRPNSDVIVRWVTAMDVTRRPRNMWIIDFGVDTRQEEAAEYEQPFAHVERNVRPERLRNNIPRLRDKWWLHRIPGANMRMVLRKLSRYIATPVTSKYRVFAWIDSSVLPDITLSIFARSDDYFMGVLHSRPHELWSLRIGSSLEDRPRYIPTMCFETYPFPFPPGNEPQGDPRVEAIAQAARELVEKRDAWLNPPGASEADLKKRTLTNLYNARPTWLDNAHLTLDAAVLDAYDWPHSLSDEEMLERLLALNLERAIG